MRKVIAVVLGALGGVVIVAGSAWGLFCREQVAYYDDFVTVRGVPQGIGEALTADRVAPRWVTWRLRRKGRLALWRTDGGCGWRIGAAKPYRLERVNGEGNLTSRKVITTYLWQDDDPRGEEYVAHVPSYAALKRVCQCDYFYGEDGRLSRTEGKDARGKVIWVMRYAPGADGASALVHYTDADGFPLLLRTDAAQYVRLRYDRNGFETRVEYLDKEGRPVRAFDGAEAVFYEWDDAGRCVRKGSQRWSPVHQAYTNIIDDAENTGLSTEYAADGRSIRYRSFGPDGKPCPIGHGLLGWDHTFDPNGNLVRVMAINTNGVAGRERDGICYREYRYERSVQTTTYFSTNHTQATTMDGVAKHIDVFNGANDTQSRVDLFAPEGQGGLDGTPDLHHDRMLFNAAGSVTNEAFFSVSEAPTTNSLGIAQVETDYNEEDRIIRRVLLAPPGAGGAYGEDAANRVVQLYDGRCTLTNETYWDAAGCATTNSEGIASQCTLVDEEGVVYRREMRALAGRGGIGGITNIATIIRLTNRSGQWTNEVYYDVGGCPTTDTRGVSRREAAYDDNGRLERTIMHAREGGAGIWGEAAIRSVARTFDAQGNITTESYFGASGAQATNRQGIARTCTAYDEEGDKTCADYYAPDKCCGIGGVTNLHHLVHRYDVFGNRTNESYFGLADLPVADDDGVTRLFDTYDRQGHLVRTDLYALDGQGGVLDEEDAHHAVKFFNEKGVCTNITYFGVSEMMEGGVAFFADTFDAEGNKLRQDICAPKGKGGILGHAAVHRLARVFDERGNATNETFFGLFDEKTPIATGVASIDSVYDGEDVLIRKILHAPEGLGGIWGHADIAHVEQRVDANENTTNEIYFSASGRPTTRNDGVSRIVLAYDENGTKVRCDHYADKGLFGRTNILHFVDLVDENDICTNRTFFGSDDKPTTNDEGATKITCRCNEDGLIFRRDYYSIEGKGGLMDCSRFHHIVHLLNAHGICTNQTLFGAGDRPETDLEGIWRTVKVYDERGRMIRAEGYAPEGQGGIDGHKNVHCRVQLLDGAGTITNLAFFGVSGQPTTNDEGVSRVVEKTNSEGLTLRIDLYSPKGLGGLWGDSAIHHTVRLYSEGGTCTNETHYGTDERPAELTEGFGRYHRIVRLYSASDCCTNATYWSAKGQPARNEQGAAQVLSEYGSDGELVRQTLIAPEDEGGLFGMAKVHRLIQNFVGKGAAKNDLAYDCYGMVVSTRRALRTQDGWFVCRCGDYTIAQGGGRDDFFEQAKTVKKTGGSVVFVRLVDERFEFRSRTAGEILEDESFRLEERPFTGEFLDRFATAYEDWSRP